MEITTGKYRTRNGRIAVIHAVEGVGTFPVKGSVLGKVKESGRRGRDTFTIWKITGQHQAVGEHRWDIIERVS